MPLAAKAKKALRKASRESTIRIPSLTGFATARAIQDRVDQRPLDSYLAPTREARSLFERAIAIRNDDPDILFRYARICARIGPEQTAIDTLRRLLEVQPEHGPGHELLSEVLATRGELSPAFEHIQKAAQLDSSIGKAWAAEIKETQTALQNSRGKQSSFVRYPDGELLKSDFGRAVDESVLTPLKDVKRFITPQTKFFTIGSCFARAIAQSLRERGYSVENREFGEHINSTFANRALVEWMMGKIDPATEPRIKALVGGISPEELKAMVANAEVIILTIGVAPCFFDRNSGNFVMPRPSALNARAMAETYTFRMTTVAENVENIRAILSTIRQINSDAEIVLTLSPVPLNSAFGMMSAVQADCISKSTLRLAVDEVTREAPTNLYYWPSFEIVRWLSGHVGQFFGSDDGVASHVDDVVVRFNIEKFIQVFSVKADSANGWRASHTLVNLSDQYAGQACKLTLLAGTARKNSLVTRTRAAGP